MIGDIGDAKIMYSCEVEDICADFSALTWKDIIDEWIVLPSGAAIRCDATVIKARDADHGWMNTYVPALTKTDYDSGELLCDGALDAMQMERERLASIAKQYTDAVAWLDKQIASLE